MSHKEALVTAAILGTEQQNLPEIVAEGKLAYYLLQVRKRLSELGKERALLHQAAIVGLYERAGLKLEKFSGAICQAAPLEELPLLSTRAAVLLRLILETQQDLLPEFLRLLDQFKKRVPEDCLYALLQLGFENESLREWVCRAVGKRGAWLAQFNSDWDYLIVESGSKQSKFALAAVRQSWDFGSLQERLSAIELLRRSDPPEGLALVRSTWKTDAAEDRIRFIARLVIGLSMDDEPFLEEQALDDKRKEVRKKAQDLLLQLSESRFSKRAKERAFACLSISHEKEQPGLLAGLLQKSTKLTVTVAVPETCDRAMLRDGLTAKSPDSRLGEKAWWLAQIIGQTNPQLLIDGFQINYEQLLDACFGSEWLMALRRGLEDSAARFENAELAKLLLLREGAEQVDSLFACLGALDQELLLGQIIERQGHLLVKQVNSYYDSFAVNLLLRMSHAWSPGFSRLILKTVRTHLMQKNHYLFMEHIMRHIGNHMDTQVWASVQDTWGSTAQYDGSLAKMMNTLGFRRELWEALKEG